MPFAKILYTVVLYPLVQIIELAFFLLNNLFDNVGVATIGVSLTVTLLCLPLYIVAESWQETERNIQSKLKPEVNRLKKTFKGDEQYMVLSTFYRQNNYHPIMALRSSFGLLIQIPFFMAAYICLSNMPALKGAHFLFIRNMGTPDALFSVGGFTVNVLPIAMTLINCISGTIYSKGHGIREKIQIYAMALVFLVVLYNSPAGLVLYWTMNNLFSLVKNVFYKMKHPLKVFYVCMCGVIVFVFLYIVFFYDGGANIKKRLSAAIPLLFLLPMPLYVRFANWLLENPLKKLTESKGTRFCFFAFATVSLCIFLGITLPAGMFASSVQEFSNIEGMKSPNQLLVFPFWQSFGIFIFWSWCVYFLFKEKIQTLLSVAFTCFLFCGIMNAYVFSGNYGSMDATLRFFDGFPPQNIIFVIGNILAIFALSALVIAAIGFKKEKIVSALSLVSIVVFLAAGIINSVRISGEYLEFEKGIAREKRAGNSDVKVSLSKNGKNVIVLMLDRCEAAYFEQILKNFPSLRDSFSGFVFYKNALSFNGHTLIGSPPIYGGYEYVPQEMNRRSNLTLKEKHNESLLLMPRLFTENATFHASLYDLSWANYSFFSDMSFVDDYGSDKISHYKLNGRYTADFKRSNGINSDISILKDLERNILCLSIFRISPAAIREALYYRGTWLDGEAVDEKSEFLDWFSAMYFMPKITDSDSEENSFLLMTNEATHSAFGFSFDELKFSNGSPSYKSCAMVLLAVGKWMDCLKEKGIYDNSRIIIVSDHGIGDNYADAIFGGEPKIDGYRKDHFYPLFLAKDFNSAAPLTESMEFMTNADVPSIALEGIVENPKNPWTGNPVNMEPKKNGALVTKGNVFMPYQSKSKYVFTVPKDSWYRVRDNIFEPQNWVQEVQE